MNKGRVVIGISGGVDSSVAALLLKNKGYEVIGITFIFTDNDELEDAKEVCKKLNIKHLIFDYKDEFSKKIINSFINDYKNGITPNPCVLCNKEMKLKLLYEKMMENNCDYIATGHYAKINKNGLYVSSDLNKDQTYFLSEVPREILNKMLLPLEGINKDEVRKIATDNNLITANKKDSTDICFINEKFNNYIKEKISPKKGKVINIDDMKEIGNHNGLSFYTIGQRRGLNIGGNDKRLYVVGKDIKKNILYVSLGDDTKYLQSNEVLISNFNLISNNKPINAEARFRYKQNLIPVKIKYLNNNEIILNYENIKGVTPGQICAVYKDNECIGGGVIKEVRKDNNKLWYL